MQINVPFGALGLGDVPALLRDVWEHTDNGTVSYELAMRVPVADSVFVVLTPTSSGVHTIVQG